MNVLERREVQIIGTRYWPIVFREDQNWDLLKLLLAKGGILPVKQRAGNMSYLDDPKGYRGAFAKSLVADHSCHFSSQLDIVKSFTSDAKITALTEHFITQENLQDNKILQELNAVIYQCVTQEKAEAICPYMVLKQMCRQVGVACTSTFSLQQLKLVQVYYSSRHRLVMQGPNGGAMGCCIAGWDRLLHSEFLLSLRSYVEKYLGSWVDENTNTLVSYLKGEPVPEDQHTSLAHSAIWFSIPSKTDIITAGFTECPPIPALAHVFPYLNIADMMKIHRLLKAAEERESQAEREMDDEALTVR
ncbi:anaphase-promoting complex subunit 1 [Elysia marginata]|uniref:Anaphase-promoting complex subunit 1 n=1 Tax=Elysia marginata TaxID=1093978 RepID=A0AAV4G0W6_9GAST|nr:anaphase-promoting complex subunit 1 [Elysia marginata]